MQKISPNGGSASGGKIYKKILFCLVIFSLLPSLALADGMVIRPDPYSDRFDPVTESDQQAYINYDQGLQKMIVSISLEKQEDQDLVWIFPVPANPQKVVIDVIDQLPSFRGEDMNKNAERNLGEISDFLTGTQIYPAIIKFLFFQTYSSSVSAPIGADYGLMSLGAAPGAVKEQDVVVYEHLEKEGITTEIITAKTASGLDEYFVSKGLQIKTDSIPVLGEYLGKDYTFIASWLTTQTNTMATETPVVDYGQYNQPTQTFDARILMNDFVLKPYIYPEISSLIGNFMAKYQELRQNVLNEQNQNTKNKSYELIFYDNIRRMPSLWEDFSAKLESNPDLVKKFQDLVAPKRNIQQPIYTPPVPLKPQKLQKGLFVTFPTDKIFFPLKPTSVYGSEQIPITVRVIGLVKPKLFDTLKPYSKISYFDNNFISSDPKSVLAMFYGDTKKESYTKIDINVPSKFLTDDLWINQGLPLKVIVPLLISRYQIITTIVLLVILSFLLSAFWGWLIFGRQKFVKFGLWGLLNVLTLACLSFATIFLKTKPIKPDDEVLFSEMKNRGYSVPNYQYRDIRKLYYLAAFTVTFTIIAWGITKLLGLML